MVYFRFLLLPLVALLALPACGREAMDFLEGPTPAPSRESTPTATGPTLTPVVGEPEPEALAPTIREGLLKSAVAHISNADGSRQGTGFVIDNRHGWVGTAAHVIVPTDWPGCKRCVRVTVFDGRSFLADVSAVNRETDLAILKLPSTRALDPLVIGSPGELMKGEEVCTAAYVRGPEHPPIMTCGAFTTWGDCGGTEGIFFQTDVLPGHSGAPLVNSQVEIVGIITRSSEAYFQGETSCAVPIWAFSDLLFDTYQEDKW